jgi:hypothetical protein
MGILNFIFNPLRRLPSYTGDANAPTLYDFDNEGYITGPSGGRTLYPGEQQGIDQYNNTRRYLNEQERKALDNFLREQLPLTWSITGIGDEGGEAGAGGTTPPRLDPLVLDLDGDGIETTRTRDGKAILFDHDADGVKTGTGWVKPDDGWLVLDRNGNGTIDSGRELFGVNTLKSNGQLATDGFDALKDLDANKDGKINSADSVFAKLRIWRDLNQDGISQANELTNLVANSITGIGVNASKVNTDLGNGNVQTAAGTFTRSNGTTGVTGETNGAAANLDLLVNTFYRNFTTQIKLTEEAKALPTLSGSGRVRDLDEAISVLG